MIKCQICGKEYPNNLGGSLTVHLLKEHDMCLEDYVVRYEMNEKEPKCQCGFCNERPVFYRGRFEKYAENHYSNEWHHEQYIKKYGQPKCLNCGKDIGFRRKKPLSFCSQSCAMLYYEIVPPQPIIETIEKIKKSKEGKYFGFKNPIVQKKIRENNLKKYGVENNSQRPEVKEKLSQRWTTEVRESFSKIMKEMWQNKEYQEKVSNGLKDNWKDSVKKDKFLKAVLTGRNKYTKIHLKVREFLNLENRGYVSEQCIAGYIVDEVNYEKKKIIEVNGDYVHANPKYYQAENIILMPGNKYTAQEKWDYDALRKKKLEDAGYQVIVIWESDDLQSFNDII